MGLKRFFAKIYANNLTKKENKIASNPKKQQEKVLKFLIESAKNTEFGKKHNFDSIKNYEDFKKNIPVRGYEELREYFDAIYNGKSDVLWAGKPLYLAKTSGTTSGSKYIPITKHSIQKQIYAAKLALLFYIVNSKNTSFLDGKMMFLSGSPELETNEFGMKIGRLSGISTHFVPSYLQTNRVPTFETNCIDDWEQKIDTILDEITEKDLRLISGIPPWVQMLFERLKERTDKKPSEIWKNISVFVQGGVDYSPYKAGFESALGKNVDVVEVYPASEGFIALQDTLDNEKGMLLLLNSGIFYEFVPLDEFHNENPTRLSLTEVEIDKQYVIILSTSAGLWAYNIGDTVKFISKNPYRIKVTGRVKHFISAFGEHVIQEEVNFAMIEACKINNAVVKDFTVAPFISTNDNIPSRHQWFVEFEKQAIDLQAFINEIDKILQEKNSYYFDLRAGNILAPAELLVLEENAIVEYMKSIGKLGGQNKFPRLSNDRKIAEFLEKHTTQTISP